MISAARHIVGPVRQQLGEPGLVPLDQLVAVPLRQVVVGVDVQTPEQLRLPRRQRLGTDRLDVDERHQAEHLQPLLGADERGELLDDVGILGIAPKRGERHPQVVANQEENDLALFVGHLQPLEHMLRPSARSRARDRRRATCPRRERAARARAARAPAGRRESIGTAADRRSSVVIEPLEVPDRQQRVLVDRVLVIEVAHHPPGDRLELREHAAEQPAIVHLREPRVETGARLRGTAAAPRGPARRRRSRPRDSDRRAAGCTTAPLRTLRCPRRAPPGTRRAMTRDCAPPARDR